MVNFCEFNAYPGHLMVNFTRKGLCMGLIVPVFGRPADRPNVRTAPVVGGAARGARYEDAPLTEAAQRPAKGGLKTGTGRVRLGDEGTQDLPLDRLRGGELLV